MRAVVAPAKLLASAISIGTGASGGREGPIVQIGGGIGSTAGRLFGLDEERTRTLIAAGAGAGIAASFNAPLSGIFFAIEIVVGGFRVRSLQAIVLTCVLASVTAREVVGAGITYRFDHPPRFTDPRELPLYVLLGLAAVVAGIAYARGEALVARLAGAWRVWPPLKPATGALGVVGVLALVLPEVLGSGDHLPATLDTVVEPVEEILNGGFGTGFAAAGFLLLLAAGKTVATCLSIGTGNSVGSFAPALFIGAALGGAFGSVAQVVLPGGTTIQPGAFALVGAAAVLGSAVRAPLTGILLAFELTNDYGMVLPLMLATGISTYVADRLDPDSIYTRPLRERGIVYAEPEDVDVMQTVEVAEVMSRDHGWVPPDLPVAELRQRFADTRSHGFPVARLGADGPELVGIVTVTDLTRADGDATAGQIATPDPVTVTPADPVSRALGRMAAIDVGRLPVVAPDGRRLLGMVRRVDLVKAYQRGLDRGLATRRDRASARLRDLGEGQVLELLVVDGAPAADREVRAVDWPPRTLLTGVRRGGELLLPTGDTVLEPGDAVVVLTTAPSVPAVRRLLTASADEPPAGA